MSRTAYTFGLLFVASIIATWFAAPGWPLVCAVVAVCLTGLGLVAALAPPIWVCCPLCGFYSTDLRNHYRKVHDL